MYFRNEILGNNIVKIGVDIEVSVKKVIFIFCKVLVKYLLLGVVC